MVYIHSWQEFQDAAEALYSKSPSNTRYGVKWKSSEGKLVLKITDNTTCIKFKTNSSIFLNRFDTLNLSLMQMMQNQRPKEETPAAASTDLRSPIKKEDEASLLPASSSTIPTATPSAGGVKKKKPKKKK